MLERLELLELLMRSQVGRRSNCATSVGTVPSMDSWYIDTEIKKRIFLMVRCAKGRSPEKKLPFFWILSKLLYITLYCVTQLKLYTGYKLSSSIFCCLWVSMSGIGNTRSNLHFFQYIQAYKPYADPVPCNTKQCQFLLTQYHQVPDSIALYWPSTCWYHL